MEIGAQLFTVRDFCKDLPALAETLRKIADIGYRHVQVSGTCAYEAEARASKKRTFLRFDAYSCQAAFGGNRAGDM